MNKQILKQLGFEEQIKLTENNICATCKKPIDLNKFKDILSIKEYKISGMCQQCQDELFDEL